MITINSTGNPAGQSGTNLTFSSIITVGSGNNRYALVAIDGSLGASDVITGVTLGGAAMTRVGSAVRRPSNRWGSLWYLANPSTGTLNLVVTNSSSDYAEPHLVVYDGVKQAAPATPGTNSGSGGASGKGTNIQGDTETSPVNIGVFSRTDNLQASTGTYGIYFSGDTLGATITTTDPNAYICGVLSTGGGAWMAICTYILPATSIKSKNGLAIASIKSINGLALASVKSVNGLA